MTSFIEVTSGIMGHTVFFIILAIGIVFNVVIFIWRIMSGDQEENREQENEQRQSITSGITSGITMTMMAGIFNTNSLRQLYRRLSVNAVIDRMLSVPGFMITITPSESSRAIVITYLLRGARLFSRAVPFERLAMYGNALDCITNLISRDMLNMSTQVLEIPEYEVEMIALINTRQAAQELNRIREAFETVRGEGVAYVAGSRQEAQDLYRIAMEQADARERREHEAEAKSMKLLYEHLDKAQINDLEHHHYFDLTTRYGHRYRIHRNFTSNVELMDIHRRYTFPYPPFASESGVFLCVVSDNARLPIGDHLLMQKLMLEYDEHHFLSLCGHAYDTNDIIQKLKKECLGETVKDEKMKKNDADDWGVSPLYQLHHFGCYSNVYYDDQHNSLIDGAGS